MRDILILLLLNQVDHL